MRRLAAALLLALTCLASACGGEAAGTRADATLARAAAWLWAQQAADGGWHSATYGLLRSGQSLTPFVLRSLLDVPEAVVLRDRAAIERALDFVERHVDADGALGRADPSLEDYPNYATGLALSALRRAGVVRPALRDRLVDCLLRQQFGEDRGWGPADPAYGGWGIGGPVRRPPLPGHVDLSMTRYVLEGLRDADLPAGDSPERSAAMRRVPRFLARCTGAEGGFHFSPVVLGANKAGELGEGFASYGTATADGVLALLALGVPAEDPRLARGRDWLVARHRADAAPNLATFGDQAWGLGMRHYYRAASARAFRALRIDEAPRGRDWRAELRAALAAEQRSDGSFRNDVFLMKEDDPLVATAFAVEALAAALE